MFQPGACSGSASVWALPMFACALQGLGAYHDLRRPSAAGGGSAPITIARTATLWRFTGGGEGSTLKPRDADTYLLGRRVRYSRTGDTGGRQ
jgi:hypothetical protein